MKMRKFSEQSLFVAFFIASSLHVAPISAWSLHRERVDVPVKSSGFQNQHELSRREIVQWGLLSTTSLLLPASAVAEEATTESQGLLSTSAAANLLHPIPTFTIVDKKGVPFMVFGEDAKVTGYFFTTYREASRILELARSSADKGIAQAKAEGKSVEEVGTNPWKKARISSVPLDSAVTLVTKSTASRGGFKVAPSEEDVEDALALTGNDDLPEGKCPLFYYTEFTIDIDGSKRTPLYFRKSELEDDFKRRNPTQNSPKMLVTELLAVLAELVKPGGTDNDLKSLVFMAPRESEKKRKECEKAGGKEAAFYIGQRIIVL
jgi:hypothetical protein